MPKRPLTTRLSNSLIGFQNQISEAKNEYYAAQKQRGRQTPRGIYSQGSGANYHYRDESDYYLMCELARNAVMNDQIVGAGIRRLVSNVVQGGFHYRPDTGSDAIDRQLKERWQERAASKEKCDRRKIHNFRSQEAITLESVITSGDIGFSPLENGTLQDFECHRIRGRHEQLRKRVGPGRTPSPRRKIVHGVETLDDAPIRYWVTKQDYDGMNEFRRFRQNDVRPIMAYEIDRLTNTAEPNFFHIFNPGRFSQNRGVSAALPIIPTASMFDDTNFAKLLSEKIQSHLTLIHKIPAALAEDYEGPPEPDYPGQAGDWQTDRGYDQVSPASHYWPEYAGEELEAFTPQTTSSTYNDQAMMFLTIISVNLDLPLILLLMDATKTNFSGWKGALDQAKIGFRRIQRWFRDSFHVPQARWQVRRWIRQDVELRNFFSSNPTAIFNHQWGLPAWPFVERLKETQAVALELEKNLTSPRRVASEDGVEYSELVKEICDDREMFFKCAMDVASRLNEHELIKKHPDQAVTWRELVYPPQGAQLNIVDGAETASQGNEANEPATSAA
jgi:capsid protein